MRPYFVTSFFASACFIHLAISHPLGDASARRIFLLERFITLPLLTPLPSFSSHACLIHRRYCYCRRRY